LAHLLQLGLSAADEDKVGASARRVLPRQRTPDARRGAEEQHALAVRRHARLPRARAQRKEQQKGQRREQQHARQRLRQPGRHVAPAEGKERDEPVGRDGGVEHGGGVEGGCDAMRCAALRCGVDGCTSDLLTHGPAPRRLRHSGCGEAAAPAAARAAFAFSAPH
jgi:hypothetical protein